MKRAVTMLFICALIFALFAGCASPSEAPAPEISNSAPPDASTPDPPVDVQQDGKESPYNYAAGKYPVNARGFPTEPYDYALPLTTEESVFTFWTTTFVNQYIPEDGMESLPLQEGMAEKTGVNIEYMIVPWDTRTANFSVMLAAGDLPDLMACGIDMYPGSSYDAVDEGHFVNIYDYKDYCPNYIYQATFDEEDANTYDSIFYDDGLIIAFYCLWQEPYYATNKVVRNDYLQNVGLSAEELVTWDDWFNAMHLIKTSIDKVEYPWPLTSAIDVKGSYSTSPSFDTLGFVNSSGLPDIYVKDGQVTFGNLTERDKDYMAKLNEFYEAGLIDPDWGGYASSASFADKIGTGQIAIMDMAATEIHGYNMNNDDPDCEWTAIARPLQYEGQVLHVGGDLKRVNGGSTSISATCENIELAVSWCDYRYSTEGSFYNSYGPQGVVWDYDENGNIRATDWALNHEMGFAWVCTLYALNNIFEHGLEDTDRKTIYEGGEIILETRAFWGDYDYDGAYEFPTGVRLSQEDTDAVNDLASDIQTYIAENYSMFLTGDKPFSEWDTYVDGVFAMDMQTIIDIYQQAYDCLLYTSRCV